MPKRQRLVRATPSGNLLYRLRYVIAALAVLVAVYWFVLPAWVRPRIERALSEALHTPVSVGSVSWRSLAGEFQAKNVRIGSQKDAFSLDELSAAGSVGRLLKGDIVLETVHVAGLHGTVIIGPEFRPALAGLPLSGGGTAAKPTFGIHRVLISSGVLTVRYPYRRQTRDARLEITRMSANDIRSDAAGETKMRAEFAGLLNGAAVRGDADLQLGKSSEIDVQLHVAKLLINREVFDLPPAFETFSGKLDGDLQYSLDAKRPHGVLSVALKIDAPRLRGEAQSEIRARRVVLPGMRVDLADATVDLGKIALEDAFLTIPLTEQGVLFPGTGGASSAGGPWRITSGAIESKNAKVELRRADHKLVLDVKNFQCAGLKSGQAQPISAEVRSEPGGSVALKGTLAVNPLALDVATQMDALALAPIAPLAAALPVPISKGTGSGELDLKYRDGKLAVTGHLKINDLSTAVDGAELPADVMAVHSADIEFAMSPSSATWLDITSLQLDYPYLMIERHPRGLFPASLFGGAAPETAAPAAAGGERSKPSIRVRRLAIENGKLEFVDATFEPNYWTTFSGVKLTANDGWLPQQTIDHFDIVARQDEISPAALSGSVTDNGINAQAHVSDLLLETMNPYVSAVLGYRATRGRLSFDGVASGERRLLNTNTDMVARGVKVEQTGVDIIQSQSGVPLPVALNLIKNLAGEIALQLPIAVDTEKRSMTFGSIIGQAIRSAILGALASPLRFLGSLFGLGGAPHAFAVDPVPFAVGSGKLDAAGEARVVQVGRILKAHPTLIIVLMPQLTGEEVTKIGAEKAPDMATQRAAAVREALISGKENPLKESRIIIVPWDPGVEAKATGNPGVYIELQAD